MVTVSLAAWSARRARSELPRMTSCGVPFMKRLTGSLTISSWIRLRSSVVSVVFMASLRDGGLRRRFDPELVDRPVGERRGQRVVDQAVPLDERETVEAGARDGHLKVVAAAGAILDRGSLASGKARRRSASSVSVAAMPVS